MLVDIEELKTICRDDLKFLAMEMFGHKDWDTLHDEVKDFLEKPALKKALLLPRGHLKTTLFVIDKAIQLLLEDPNIRILIANQVWDKARDMLSEIKELLDTKSNLPKIFGTFKSELWNKDAITIAQRTQAFKEPTISTTGVEAETTGGHYNVIFLDDLMGHQNSQTLEQREKVKKFRRTMVDLLEPGGRIYEIGTRWSNDDTFGEILRKETDYYDIMVRKVVENGKVIFPKKFNKRFDSAKKTFVHVEENCLDWVDLLRKSHTPAEFSAQYLNEPIAEEDQLFKEQYFRYYQQRPNRLYVCMTLDPAASLEDGADYFAINVSGMDEFHNIYVLDTLKGRWRPSEQIENIFTTYLKWRPSNVGIETVAYQKTLKYSLEEKMREKRVHFPLHELKRGANTTKELRIKALEPYYRANKVFHANWMKSLEAELLEFPKGRHDDEIDSLASQLELLLPGASETREQINPDSWEAAFRQARKFSQPYRDFFHEVPYR